MLGMLVLIRDQVACCNTVHPQHRRIIRILILKHDIVDIFTGVRVIAMHICIKIKMGTSPKSCHKKLRNESARLISSKKPTFLMEYYLLNGNLWIEHLGVGILQLHYSSALYLYLDSAGLMN